MQQRRPWYVILFVLCGVLAALAAAPASAVSPPVPAGLDAALWHRAVALTRHSLAVDTHCDG